MSAETLEDGYWGAYRAFYSWGSILQGAWSKPHWAGRVRHLAYSAGWKKFEPLWDWAIRLRWVGNFLPFLEAILEGFGRRQAQEDSEVNVIEDNSPAILDPEV